MPARTIAIGDVHGCSLALRAIVDAIHPGSDDSLIFLGDYIDRGPDSRGVLDFLMQLETRCQVIPLLGNHEIMLLEAEHNPQAFEPWLACGGAATVSSYDGQVTKIPPAHWEFMRRCRRYYETDTHFFVHANYAATVPLNRQPDYLLFWEHLHVHSPAAHQNGKIAVVGHTAQKSGEVLDGGRVICLDTFCYGGGWLTAMDIDTGYLWQANRDGTMRVNGEMTKHE